MVVSLYPLHIFKATVLEFKISYFAAPQWSYHIDANLWALT